MLINLEDVDCFQLPCVEEFNDEVIANIVQNRGTPNSPCHSQAVKRADFWFIKEGSQP